MEQERADYAEPGSPSGSPTPFRRLLAPALAVAALCAMALVAYFLTLTHDDGDRPPRPATAAKAQP